jgi:hypothetical protein
MMMGRSLGKHLSSRKGDAVDVEGMIWRSLFTEKQNHSHEDEVVPKAIRSTTYQADPPRISIDVRIFGPWWTYRLCHLHSRRGHLLVKSCAAEW